MTVTAKRTPASDQVGINTDLFFTYIRRFLHFASMQIFETRTFVKALLSVLQLEHSWD